MYQKPDFVRVDLNVSDSFASYTTTTTTVTKCDALWGDREAIAAGKTLGYVGCEDMTVGSDKPYISGFYNDPTYGEELTEYYNEKFGISSCFEGTFDPW